MGLFHRNESEANFAGGSKNVMESIQRATDTNTLIYLDPQVDFNTNSVITVAPNEQVIFIKNGEFYGTLPSGRHEIKSENYPLLSRIRNMLTGGMSTFTCQVYHVSTSEQTVRWGTPSPIAFPDHFLGTSRMGVKTHVTSAGEFRVCFNIKEDDDAAKQTFMKLVGDKSAFTVNDLSLIFSAQISQKIGSVIGKTFERLSWTESINGITSKSEEVAELLTPEFELLFLNYGLELINFSFRSIDVEDDENRQKYLDRVNAAELSTNFNGYDKAVQQELLKDVAINPAAGGIASAGAGLGMGMAAGNAFAQMATTAFSQPQQPQAPQQPMGFGGQNRFGVNNGQQQPSQQPVQPDPMESLMKMKQMLDAGLITQDIYNAKVAEIMSRM